ncbi:hypothetical protein CQ018_16220 [Arthrobacter sp. MYb227]|uniref:peptidoglycan DD-metalloendopeptidase family protein n=1 Tax=Arthrobacter sp. MYb227 TaxID=1848601 RepID=UPI000D4C55CF|nr:peptidoglycan DD-metalloendopeptidase family protein [Arthrobacter sp. MYb227]PQZ89089.1 hypothetical protein CQ018_16220 [Arthrobacter sp. MYb227]
MPTPLTSRRELRAKPKSSRLVILVVATLAALALSAIPVSGARDADSISIASPQGPLEEASFQSPVAVGLHGGVDAIRWDAENITSAAAGAELADAADPDAMLGVAGSAAQLVGQTAGPLGVLPAGLQLIHPVSSRRITSPYGWRSNPTGSGTQIHIGQDYAIGCGSPVYATADGKVIQSAWAGHSGMRVTIDHGSNVRTGYSHNSKLIASVGDTVKQGQLIALSGTTGNSTGCHVHFEVIIDGRWNDPRNFLPLIPGQPNPMIDSRRTTIAAAPIRNTGKPQTDNGNGHDIEVPIPEKTKSAPATKSSQNGHSPMDPSKENSAAHSTPSSAPTTALKPTPESPSVTTGAGNSSSTSSPEQEQPTIGPSEEPSLPEATPPTKAPPETDIPKPTDNTGNGAGKRPGHSESDSIKKSEILDSPAS